MPKLYAKRYTLNAKSAFTLIELLVARHPKRWRRKAISGFTLIELLVVISIMAVLAGAILYSTDNTREKSRDAQRKENLKTINSALVSYHVDNNNYPPQTGTQRDFASDSADSAGWIPNISTYLEKLPKDPQQANSGRVAGIRTYTKRIVSGADDVQIRHFAPDFSTSDDAIGLGRSDIPDASTAPFPNNDHMKVGLRFTNVNIPKDATITSAKLIFTPRNSTAQEQTLNNAGTSGPIDQRVNIFITSDISQANSTRLTSANDFYGRLGSIAAIDPAHYTTWRNIPQWNPAPNSNATEVDITSLVQKNVQINGWASGNAMNILMHPEDPHRLPGDPVNPYAMNLDSRARFFFSYDDSPSQAPELIIEWDDGISPSTCDDPNASNFGGSPPCTYPPSPPDRGACDNKQGIFCLRVNDDKSAYVLWTQLENINDREHFSKSEATCNQNDPDFDSSNTSSPYYGLGRPAGGFLNYCIKSPQ